MGYLIVLVCMMVLVMNLLKIVFSELDGRRANKQFNVRYFLQFTKSFSYGRTSYIIFIALIIFLFTGNQTLFSIAWILEFVTLLCVSVIIDVISQYAGYTYSKRRFKEGINKAITIEKRIREAVDHHNEEDIIYPELFLDFKSVVEDHMNEEDHSAFASMDGGEFVDSLENLPPITYVIDTRKAEAEERLSEKGIKVISLTKENGIPFKDEKIDTYVCEYTNFNKEDVLRILKPGGQLLVHQCGGDNLKELNTLYLPVNSNTKWNKYACQTILDQNGFIILDGQEQLAKIGFRSISGLFTYLKKVFPAKVKYWDVYINQFAYIEECIRQRGFFEMTIHEFYLVCRKK